MGLPEPGPTPTDDALVARWIAGDEAAFDQLVTRHGPALHGFLKMTLGDSAAAEDAWSETWVRVVRARSRYVAQGQFRAWLFSIGRRCAKDQSRSIRRRLRLGAALEEHGARRVVTSPALRLVRSREARALDASLQGLKEEHRSVLLLTYRYDMSSEEVGQILGLTGQQVRSRITYARRLLRESLARRGVGDDR